MLSPSKMEQIHSGRIKTRIAKRRQLAAHVKSFYGMFPMASGTSWDDRGFQQALKQYLDFKKNVQPQQELRRRAKNIGLRLIKIYKEKGAKISDISASQLPKIIKIRPKIRAKAKANKLSYTQMRASEIRARRSAIGFTATGWFPPVKKLGGQPRDKGTRTGPQRGKLVEQLAGNNISETLINQQPAAALIMQRAPDLCQKVLDNETADMVKYIVRKMNDAAKKAGLTP